MDARLYYVKEYEEVLSRLSAPERTPGPFIPRPLGPVPYYKTAENWNKIMRETRHGVLPKYTITQRCNCDYNEKVRTNDADKIHFRFKLDPNFAFCQGARKSIAIREIDYFDPLLQVTALPDTAPSVVMYVVYNEFTISIADNTNANLSYSELVSWDETIDYSDTTKIWTSSDDFNLKTVCEILQERMNYTIFGTDEIECKATGKTYKLSELLKFEVTCEDRNINIKFYALPQEGIGIMITGDIMISFKDDYGKYAMGLERTLCTTVNTFKTDWYPDKTDSKLKVPLMSHESINFVAEVKLVNHKHVLIGSSINPWSKGNVIGYTGFKSDTLNKIFPWDGCDEIVIWAIDHKAHQTEYYGGNFTVELELIVDNEDSYAINE